MTRRTICNLSLCLALVMSLYGCGAKQPVKTEAKVTIDGTPVAGATITFVPEKAAEGRPASGLSGPDGTAAMTTDNFGDGVIPGVYKVTVSKSDVVKGPATQPASGDPGDAIKASYSGFAKDTAKKPGLAKTTIGKTKEIPETYSDPAKTPFKFTVPIPGGKADLPIQKGKS